MSRPGAAALRSRSGATAVTVADVRRRWAGRFRSAGIDSPELDARILVGHVLGLDHAGLAAAGIRPLDHEQARAIAALAERRLAREPVARIVGSKEFWSLKLRIDAATFVPRPESETVVARVLAAIDAEGPRSRPLRIADLGTGSGALLLALLSELPDAFGVGTDASVAALAMARDNSRSLGLACRAAFVACDVAAALAGSFDAIVANPPYVATGDIAALASDVRDFDPRRALDGGADGLGYYRTIAATAPALLAPDGVLVVELGAGQAGSVEDMFRAAGLALAPPSADLEGVDRALLARSPARAGR